MTTNGVIYIAFGDKYVAEAVRSAQSIKTHTPELPITLFTERTVTDAVFERVIQVPAQPFQRQDKPRYMAQTPYARTLFLDTDTLICGDIGPLFALLDRFDFCAAHGQDRVKRHDVRVMSDVIGVTPLPFAQFNSGVILYKQSAAMPLFFAEWVRLIERNLEIAAARGVKLIPNDQTALREAIYASSLHMATLTPEYHCRPGFAGFLSGQVKILHGRRYDLARAAELLNRSTEQRVHVNLPSGLIYYSRSDLLNVPPPSRWTRLQNSLRTRGAAGTLRVALKRLAANDN